MMIDTIRAQVEKELVHAPHILLFQEEIHRRLSLEVLHEGKVKSRFQSLFLVAVFVAC
jgi:hypothetical protein